MGADRQGEARRVAIAEGDLDFPRGWSIPTFTDLRVVEELLVDPRSPADDDGPAPDRARPRRPAPDRGRAAERANQERHDAALARRKARRKARNR